MPYASQSNVDCGDRWCLVVTVSGAHVTVYGL